MKIDIQIKNLTVKYGTEEAVKQASFCIEKGKIAAYIGLNGSGKSTTFKSILGLIKNYSGDIYVDEVNIKKSYMYRKLIGYIPENIEIYNGFTGREYLTYYAGLHGINPEIALKNLSLLIDSFSMKYALNNFVYTYSKGMKQKLSIIASFINKPTILLLDEPFDGLDPHSINIYSKILKEFSSNGGTVLISSHILKLVEGLVNQVIIINKGKIIYDGDINSIEGSLSEYFDTLVEDSSSLDIPNIISNIYNE